MPSLTALLLGFIAGALATPTIHELIIWGLQQSGIFLRPAWPLDPYGPLSVPRIANATFWGGLWGSVFALAHACLGSMSLTIKGLIFGILGPALIGVFVLVPLIKGGSIFLGGDVIKIAAVCLVLAGWGAMTGFVYGLLNRNA